MRKDIPNLGALQAFEASARLGSFTRAATELALTQSAVGRQVAMLEQRLGVPLFSRVRKRLTLTDVGREHLAALGLSLPVAAPRAVQRFAYPCIDWSERRDHLAGSLAVALLAHGLEKGWLLRVKDSRALTLTHSGEQAWAPWLNQTRTDQERSMRAVSSKEGGGALRERQAL